MLLLMKSQLLYIKNMTKLTQSPTYYEDLNNSVMEQLKDVATEDLPTNVDTGAKMEIVEKQRTYIWIRLYLKEEISDLESGDLFTIEYDNESLDAQFIVFGRKNLLKDNDDNIINYDNEDDTKQLCIMVDQDTLTSDIPFIRSLFRSTPFFEYQVYRRTDLKFINTRTSESYEYIDVEF